MHLRTLAIPLLAIFPVLGSCKRDATQPPDLVERSAVYTLEDGRVVRIPTYRSEYPVLGQCVEDLTYALSAGSCVTSSDGKPFTTSPNIPVRMLDKQGFRAFSRQLSVESSLNVNASGQEVKTKVVVAKHRLFIEWNRYAVYSIDPFKLKKVENVENADPYVSGVEYGIGVRVILDVTLTDVDATANLSFGFGSIGANVATKKAQIAVQYDTIGVSRDILPENLPMAIESVGDLTKMLMGLYGAVENISKNWNARVDKQRLGDVKIGTIEAPWLLDRSTQPDGVGDTIDTTATVDSTGATPVILGDTTTDIPSEQIKDLVNDVNSARATLDTLDTKNSKLGALYRRDDKSSSPIIGGQKFDDLLKQVMAGERVDVDDVQALFDSVAEHADALEGLDAEDRKALERLPESLRTAAAAHLTLSAYYPALRGDEDELFPRGFSAAPIAYYVMRTPTEIERDYCDTLQLNFASRQKAPSSRALEKCLPYWSDVKVAEQAYCYAIAQEFASKRRAPGWRLERKCRKGYWDPAGILPLDQSGLQDPAGKDPVGKDPAGKDPAGKDPSSGAPAGKDPSPGAPAGGTAANEAPGGGSSAGGHDSVGGTGGG